MTPKEVNRTIEQALRSLGNPEPESLEFFLEVRFKDIRWLPTYAKRIGKQVWAIELSRGDRIPEHTVKEMVKTRDIDNSVQPAFFIPEGEHYEHLLQICKDHGIALIVKTADEYEVQVFPSQLGVQQAPLLRIPEWVIDDLSDIRNLQTRFQETLNSFRQNYQRLVSLGRINDEAQEKIIRKYLQLLLGSDDKWTADYAALDLLSFFEHNSRYKRRDHYFHSFNDFLLGCLVIDRCYDVFEQFRRLCSLKKQTFSIEYVWLLSVLFHDIGYPIQEYIETSELLFGVGAVDHEQAINLRRGAWQELNYSAAVVQLVSLFDYLSQDKINDPWIAETFLRQREDHPLYKAFEKSFLSQGHGVASCMRMLADFFRSVPKTVRHRQFLARHVFIAGLSIPFHDWQVRKALREEGIITIRTSRFPFASLLMFLDSIQEDRRGQIQEPDILKSISVANKTVTAQMDLTLLTAERLAEKKREAKDVKNFLEEDLLKFRYPEELIS